MFETLLQMLAPHYCVNCNAKQRLICEKCIQLCIRSPAETCYRCNALSPENKTCRSCRSSGQVFSLHKITYYEPPMSEVIIRMKYAAARQGASELGRLVADRLTLPSADLVTYVPTDTARVRQRGFDHAKIMAKVVCLRTNTPIMCTLARRAGHTKQTGSSRRRRMEQMKESLEVVNTDKVAGRHVLLVDDVVSTGASVEAAAALLRDAGAKRVHVAVAAHNR